MDESPKDPAPPPAPPPGPASAAAPPPPGRRGSPLWLHLLLFGVTCVCVTLAMGLSAIDPARSWGENLLAVTRAGGQYAATLMGILLAHEMGHYLTARRHGVPMSLPYFLPGPPVISFGTFGAFIRMQGRVSDPRALLDIGLAGPLAGLVVALPALVLGLSLSPVQPLAELAGGLYEGNSLLYLAVKRLVLGPIPAGYDVSLHPVAFAGWMGLLVTSLNLFPVGQLDGGHITHALFGERRAATLARLLFVLLILLGAGVALVAGQFTWVVWVVLIALIGIRHPPTGALTAPPPLGPVRRALGYFALLLFVVTFTPVPLSDEPPGGWKDGHEVPQVSGMRDGGPAVVPGHRPGDRGAHAERRAGGRGPGAPLYGDAVPRLRRPAATDPAGGGAALARAPGGTGPLGPGAARLDDAEATP